MITGSNPGPAANSHGSNAAAQRRTLVRTRHQYANAGEKSHPGQVIPSGPPLAIPICGRNMHGTNAVPVYIQLMRFTEKGIANVEASPGRLDAAEAMLQEMGGRFLDFWMTMGEYDLVAVIEAPDDETPALFTLRVGAMDDVRTTTLKAFPEGECREICARVP